jgi:hypothetical protein
MRLPIILSVCVVSVGKLKKCKKCSAPQTTLEKELGLCMITFGFLQNTIGN